MSDPISGPAAGGDPTDERDATDRVAELTETYQSSPLTDPEKVLDPEEKGVDRHGDSSPDPAAVRPSD